MPSVLFSSIAAAQSFTAGSAELDTIVVTGSRASLISGISVENDQGEGRYVVMRGFSPEFNSIYLNESSIVAQDQDADSIGGRVDFRTLSSLDLGDSMVRIKLDSAYNDLGESNSSSMPRGSSIFCLGR